MEGMGLKFTPLTGRCLLCHSSMFGPMADTSGTYTGLTIRNLKCLDKNPGKYVIVWTQTNSKAVYTPCGL